MKVAKVDRTDVLVVGAGPGGLTAALEARRLGADVTIVDEQSLPGGQYYRQPSVDRGTYRQALAPETSEGAQLIDAVRRAGVQILSRTEVWGAFSKRRLAAFVEGENRFLEAERIILATGAHDRTFAFPGWTLPGVVTPGAAQTLIKAQALKPGSKAVVAGSGPFLLVVAAELLKAGVHVVAYVESTSFGKIAAASPRFFPFSERWGELLRYAYSLLRGRVPVYFGHMVTGAAGDGAVRQVTIAPLDGSGNLVHEGKAVVEADLLSVAHGFRASSELAMLMGCGHRYDDAKGGWIVETDPDTFETSVPGVYAVGEARGVAGSRVARLEGAIAGLIGAETLRASHGNGENRGPVGGAPIEERLKDLRRKAHREAAFSELVNDLFRPPPLPGNLLEDDTVVCRCEEVTTAELASAVEAGAETLDGVKMWTRCGMGHCQGRICGWTAAAYVAGRTGKTVGEVGVNRPRMPLKPIELHSLLPPDAKGNA